MSSINMASQTQLAEQILNARVTAHAVHAANIANAETPQYKAKIPEFQVMMDSLAAEQQKQAAAGGLEPVDPWKAKMNIGLSPEPAREDGNNVRLEHEMSAMMENSILYLSSWKILNREMAIHRYAIAAGDR